MQDRLLEIAKYKAKFRFPIDIWRIYLPYNYRVKLHLKSCRQDGRFLYYKALDSKIYPTFVKVFSKRASISYHKILKVGLIIKLLAKIPFIEAIFLSGSVASLNARKGDDIDILLFIKPGRLWLTRALEMFLLGSLKVRRFKNCKDCKDKLCMNFYKSVKCLEFRKHDIAFATQFVESIPLYIKHKVFWYKLVKANKWVRNYYPEWWEQNIAIRKLPSNWFNEAFEDVNQVALGPFYKFIFSFLQKIDKILPFTLRVLDILLGIFQTMKARTFVSFSKIINTSEITTWENKLRVYRCASKDTSSAFKKRDKKTKQSI